MARIDEIRARLHEYRDALASCDPDAPMRASISKIAIDSWAVGDLEFLIDEIGRLRKFTDHICELHTCNDCGIANACETRLARGDTVRYNCPLRRECK